MAGKKETPRQKMIGMMYLVLTALLALNVSTTVLDKFTALDESLQRSVRQTQEYHRGIVSKIEATVDKAGNRPSDVAVLNKAKQVRKLTAETISKMESQFREKFVEITGGRDQVTGKINGWKNYDRVGAYMLPENDNHGIELKKLLNSYSDQVGDLSGLEFDPLAYDAKDHPQYSKEPNQKGKDFATLYFENTPTGAGMATISQFETELLALETAALEELAEKVGAKDIKFDRIVPMVRPESKIVPAGMKYQADMFIAASSSGITPEMFVGEDSIPVDVDGLGKVEFTATPGSYDANGVAKKSFIAKIKIAGPAGDTTYIDTVEYFVAKPVIQVQSASVQALYYRCGNELNVNVPALGSSYNPSFSASGGSAIKGSKVGEVTIVPTAGTVRLTVSSNGNTIGTEEFKVRPVPKPEIQFFNRGRPVNDKAGEKISALRQLEVRPIPDEGFKTFLPKDARYRVTEWTITLARGPRPVGSPITTSNQTANVSALLGRAKPGDRLVVEVKKVMRMNFQNKTESVNVGTVTKSIPLN